MRFIVLSFLLLSLFLCFSAVSVRGQYAGVFLDPASKIIAANLQQNSTWNVSPYDVLNSFPDDSYKRTQAHHLTIEFQPNPVTKYQKFYQDIHHIKVLAYAHDNKGQAVLVELEDNPCKTQGGIEIMNAWPHVTLTDSTKAPYTAVYSNDLIDRLIAANVIQVKKVDSYGKPTKVQLGVKATRGSDEWWGSIPAFNSTTSTAPAARPYAAGVAYVKIFPQQGRNVVRLTGTVCINTAWNDTTVSCTAPKVQA